MATVNTRIELDDDDIWEAVSDRVNDEMYDVQSNVEQLRSDFDDLEAQVSDLTDRIDTDRPVTNTGDDLALVKRIERIEGVLGQINQTLYNYFNA